MKNKLLELQIQALVEEKKALFKKFSETPLSSADWFAANTNYSAMIANIDFRIDALLLQIEPNNCSHED